MPQQIQSTFTRTALYLELLANGNFLSSATGFVIRPLLDETSFLVTNWHALSGRNPETNECLSRTGAIPDAIRIHHHSRRSINEREPCVETLYLDAEMAQPRWLEHPRGQEIDVVVLPLVQVAEPVAIQAMQLAWFRWDLLELPGLAVSVIGFPFALHVGGRWPIWKTGHIASDLGYDYDDRPSFLIDITTREGMSGAPIVYQSSGPYSRRDGEQAINAKMQRQFLGVYSGRIHESSEIGRGWRPEVVLEILDYHKIQYYL